MRIEALNDALGMLGLVPFKPGPRQDPQAQEQPEFLPGSLEALVQAAIKARGWSYNLVCLHPQVQLALLDRWTETEQDMRVLPEFMKLLSGESLHE